MPNRPVMPFAVLLAVVAACAPQRAPSTRALRASVDSTMQRYAAALETKSVDSVRGIYVGMNDKDATQLRDAYPNMRDVSVQMAVDSMQVTTSAARVAATGHWIIVDVHGRHDTLTASNIYTLERQRGRWVITHIE